MGELYQRFGAENGGEIVLAMGSKTLRETPYAQQSLPFCTMQGRATAY
jgi:hypothetical protein